MSNGLIGGASQNHNAGYKNPHKMMEIRPRNGFILMYIIEFSCHLSPFIVIIYRTKFKKIQFEKNESLKDSDLYY